MAGRVSHVEAVSELGEATLDVGFLDDAEVAEEVKTGKRMCKTAWKVEWKRI